MLMSGSDTCFLEVSAYVSLKVAIKGSFRGKKLQKFSKHFKAFSLKQKRGSTTKKIEVILVNFGSHTLFSYIFSESNYTHLN